MSASASYPVSASCPVCGYEHDFATVREMEHAWAKWLRRIKEMKR